MKLDLQMFADLDEVIVTHKEQLADIGESTTHFKALKERLGKLGYDVLLNHKEKAEFVPSSRLSDIAGQRDGFKSKVEELNTQLESLKASSKGNEELQGKLQEMMDKNNLLLSDLEKTKINTEIMLSAKDAINAKDILVFVDFSNIKANSKGEILGVESEINRLKAEKPYLFHDVNKTKNKGGMENGSRKDEDLLKGNMNSMIRKMAGRL